MRSLVSRLGAFAPAFLLVSLTLPIRAATPDHATVDPDHLSVTWSFGPMAANVSGQPAPVGGDTYACNDNPSDPCDVFTLTVTLPAGYRALHPKSFIHVEAATTSTASDIDLQLADQAGKNLVTYRDNPPDQPHFDYDQLQDGTTVYQVQVAPGSPVEGGSGKVTLNEGAPPPPPDGDGDGIPDSQDACPNTPPGTPVDSTGCVLAAGNPATCDAPGLTILTDATKDNSPPTTGTDLKSFAIYQPAQNPATGNKIEDQLIAFVINVDANGVPNASTGWFVSFNGPGGLMGVRMTGDASGAPVFQQYIPGASNSGAQDGRFVTAAQPADASSSFDATKGVITIKVKAINLGFTRPGQQLTDFNAGVTVTTDPGNLGAGGTAVVDGMPTNDLATRTGSYTLHDNTVCGRPQLQAIGPPRPATGPDPRFYFFQSPEGLADAAGEPSIGWTPQHNYLMFIARTEVDRIVPAEHSDLRDAAGNPLPESCDAQWVDKSWVGAADSLDPILETWPATNRTFQSSLTGANSIFAYSDDDGDTWTPGQAGPPNGGADHQTMGIGPWPAGAKPASATVDYAIYYCSQSVAAAFCARSDDGGISFGPGIAFRNSVTDCDNSIGGLHGHTQVGPDGAVYVPFGNCGAKTAVAVSMDAGVTWKVKKVQPSQAGGDPGLGIASDNTMYLCYLAGDPGKVFATVSKDHGDTWSTPYEIGASVGIQNAVFTTMVAGDADRAACGFLGTTTPGNAQSLDFDGYWYPYVATTYDGGQTWHLTNTSPGDPAQGKGGICTAGTTCGSNRNLLDFTDIQKTEQGRIVFAYADGCKGACVQNPEQNTFSDNGVIARQSGGATLLSAFDDKPGTQFETGAPVTPGAACARADLSQRTKDTTRVNWTAPDTGGSAITNYKLYRATSAAGPFSFVGDAGPRTYLVDPTTDPNVAHYFYKVVTENAQGASGDSNVIDLPITVPTVEDSCALPGITVAEESAPGACVGTGGGCTPQTDVQKLSVAELPTSPDKLTVTIKVASLNPSPAPDQYYYVVTKKITGENLYLAMDTSQGTPRYTYGTWDAGTATSFSPTEVGTIDPSSSFDTDGSIHLVADRALFGNAQAGDVISSIETRTRVGSSEAPSRDNIGPGDYTVRGTKICAPNTPPVAVLTATPQTGGAPLVVEFDGSGSFDVDSSVPDTIKTYVINFGDGSGASATDGQAPHWTHTYASTGSYAATLRVVDSRGKGSDGAAQKVIEVTALKGPVGPDITNNRLAGALSLWSVLAMAGLGALRRRRPRGRGKAGS